MIPSSEISLWWMEDSLFGDLNNNMDWTEVTQKEKL